MREVGQAANVSKPWNIAVGSKNPAKYDAVQQAFGQLDVAINIVRIDAPSGVSNQPFSDDETMQGAVNRAKVALAEANSDWGIGLEGGVIETVHGMLLCNYAAVAAKDGTTGVGGGVRVALPEAVARRVRQGLELGDVIDEWSGGTDIRKGEGTIGILTRGHITRSQMFRDAILCALAPYMMEVQR